MTEERRSGHSKLYGKPLDEDGAIEFVVMKPSEEARWKAREVIAMNDGDYDNTEEILEAAYAIDFAALQKENERLKREVDFSHILSNQIVDALGPEYHRAPLVDGIHKLKQQLKEKEASYKALEEDIASLDFNLRQQLAASGAECEVLRVFSQLPADMCLSCGGRGGHAEGCNGTTVLLVLQAENTKLKEDLKEARAALKHFVGDTVLAAYLAKRTER